MSKKATCQLTRKQGLAKGEYITLTGGNIHIEADGTISTLGTKQGVCFATVNRTSQWFIQHSKWISEREHASTGAKSEKIYQLDITVKIKAYDKFNSLSILATKYLLSIISVHNDTIIRCLSCKYRKYQKLSKVIDQLQEYFDVLDYSIREYDENEGTVRYFTAKAKNVDTIRTLQESRATNQWNYAWTTSKKTRPEDKRIKLAE